MTGRYTPRFRPVSALPLLLCLFLACGAVMAEVRAAAPGPEPQDTPRIVALGGPIVEILYGLGLGEQIVGRTRWTAFPPAVLRVPDMGDAAWPDLEAIVSQRPGRVLTDGHFGSLESRLAPHGIPVDTLAVYETGGMVRTIRQLGVRFDREQGAELFLDRILAEPRALLQQGLSRVDPGRRPKGLIVAGAAGVYFTFSRESGRTTLEDAGAHNLAADLAGPFPVVSREWVLANRPDFILHVPPEGPADAPAGLLERAHEGFVREAVFGTIPVVTMDGPLTYGPRALWGAVILAAHLHPDAFQDLDVTGRYRDFMVRVYGIASGALPPDRELVVP